MSLLDILQEEHDQINELLEQILETTTAADIRSRQEFYNKLYQELVSHMRLEEDILYARTKDLENGNEIIEESLQEHHLIDIILNELNEEEVDSPEWEAKLEILQENIDHHLAEEENDLYPKVKRHFSAELLKQLGQEYEARKSVRTKRVA